MTQDPKQVQQEIPEIPFADFLEVSPPSHIVKVSDFTRLEALSRYNYREMNVVQFPEIQLHCGHERCNGIRFHRTKVKEEVIIGSDDFTFAYVTYLCSNCRENEKIFSLALKTNNGRLDGVVYKFGELPLFGPPVSPKLIKLIGPDRDIFLKGRRCENQGLGIGAFVYYRRVIENQKNRIFDEIIKVAQKVGADAVFIEQMETAKKETQFSKAVSTIKVGLPQILLINGHNPLTLLHTALSDGLHDRTDEHCIELAGSIRIVLGELSDRLASALKDEQELTKALGQLMKIKNP